MKKIISALAALSIICGSVCAAVPVAAADTTAAVTESTGAKEYDLEGSHTSSEADGITYNVYSDFAVVTKVSSEDIEEFTVPETYKDKPVVGLTDAPFAKCKNLKKINLSKNVAVFNWGEIAEEGIEEVTVSEDNEYLTSVDGVIYTKDKKELLCCPTACGKTELTLADETESIMPCAFACCRDLKKLTMNDKLENIYHSAFWGCSGLAEVKFSKSLKVIGYMAFAGCSSLKEIDLPDSLEEIHDNVFRDAACVKTVNDIQYADNWAVGSSENIKEGIIEEGTVGIASGIFSSRYWLKYIVVPSTVKHITEYMLVALGKNMDIDYVEFRNDTIPERCLATNGIKEIRITNPDCKIEDTASAIPAYWVKREQTPIVVSDETPIEYTLKRTTVTTSSTGSHNQSVAVNTELYELVEDENGKITWVPVNGNGSADSGDKQTELSEKIQNYMNEAKVYSAPIKIDAAAKYDTVIRGFERSTAEEYALKYRRVFDTFEPASTVVGPEHVTDYENHIDYVVYGKSYAIAAIRDSYDPRGTNRKKEITIPEEINGVPVTAYRLVCGDADVIHLPKTVKTILYSVDVATSYNCSYDIDKDNPYLTSVDGIIYSKDMTKLIKVPSKYEGKKIVVPDGVKSIEDFAMFGLRNVETIELPDSLEEIKYGAFIDATKLKSINLPENLDFIGDRAFNYCIALEDIKIPESVKGIGLYAFYKVPAVKYEGGLGYLDNWLVETEEEKPNTIVPKEGITGMARVCAKDSLVIPKSVTKMGWEVLALYNSITRADVYSHVIDYDAFKNARYLKDIYIYDPDCEICAGDQTIPAKYIDTDNRVIKTFDELVPDIKSLNSRTSSLELKADDGEELGDVVIHGYAGSTAEAYAKMYGIKFEELDTSKVYKGGDLNGDGKLNVADLVMISRYIHGLTSLDEKQTKSADLNGDGNVDIFDMVEFRKKILESMRDN